VDLAKDPLLEGSLARSTTENPSYNACGTVVLDEGKNKTVLGLWEVDSSSHPSNAYHIELGSRLNRLSRWWIAVYGE
jgi:hypothetical protein